MADMRRPNRSPGSAGPARRPGERPAPGSRPAARPPARPPSSRRPAAKKGATPLWMWLTLIVSPIVLIGLLLFTFAKKTEEAPPPKKEVTDPNARIRDLEKEVTGYKAAYREILSGKDDAAAKKKREALLLKIDKWMVEWDEIFEPKRVDGKLPKELAAYQQTRAEINTLRLDIMKTTGFE